MIYAKMSLRRECGLSMIRAGLAKGQTTQARILGFKILGEKRHLKN